MADDYARAAAMAAEQAKRNAQRDELGLGDQRRGAAPGGNYAQTKFGNTQTLIDALAPNQVLRLLDLNLAAIEAKELYHSGAWVLSMSAFPTGGNALNLGGVIGGSPILVTVTMGAGGAAIPFQFTLISGASIQIPAGAVSVDVSLSLSTGQNMIVQAIIQRGQSARQPFFLQSITAPTSAAQTIPVPNFVDGVRVEAAIESIWYTNEMLYVSPTNVQLRGTGMRALVQQNGWMPVDVGRTFAISALPAASMLTYPPPGSRLLWRLAL